MFLVLPDLLEIAIINSVVRTQMGKSTMKNVKVKSKTKDNQTMAITENNIHNAWTLVKQLTNALRYFQDAVEKEIHSQLPGASSILLDIVVSCYTELGAYLINKDRSAKMLSATDRVYQSLTELMKWSDRVLIEESFNYNRDEVIHIVGNLKESVNTLVQLCVDHYQSRDSLVKSSTSLSLKNEETYENDNHDRDIIEDNTAVKDNCKNFVARKSTNSSNHSEFSLSHHRNSLPDLNPLPLPQTTQSNSHTIATLSATIPRHPTSSLASTSSSISTPVTESFSSTGKPTAARNDNLSHVSVDHQQQLNSQQKFDSNSSNGRPTKCDLCVKNYPSCCSERFPHSLSTDSLLSEKFIENMVNMKINVPRNNNSNIICPLNIPGGKRGGIIINSANFGSFSSIGLSSNRSQINSFTSSCVSTSSSSSSGVTDYPDLGDIPPPLPPKKKLSIEMVRSPPRRPFQVNTNSSEMAQSDATFSSTFNCQSHHVMSLESFSSLLMSECKDFHSVTTDTSNYRFQKTEKIDDSSSHKIFSSQATTETFIQQQQQKQDKPANDTYIDSRSSKNGSVSQDPHNLSREMLTDDTDDSAGEPPPELPVKLRRRNLLSDCHRSEEIVRPPSQYDNISDVNSTSTSLSSASTSNATSSTCNERSYKYDWSSASTWQSANHSISCPMHLSHQAGSSTNFHSGCFNFGEEVEEYDDFSKPPPLPPKQRNIMTYMTMLNNGSKYDGPNDAVLNLYRHSVHTYHLINSASKPYSWQQQLEATLNSAKGLKKLSSPATGSDDSILSLESSSETSSSNISYQRIPGETDSEMDKPPILPPKAKSQSNLQQPQQQQQQHQHQQSQSQLAPIIDNQTQFPESQPVNQNSIKPVKVNEVDSIVLTLKQSQQSSLPRSSSPTIPSSESGISSQSESIRTTDECKGPLDEIDVSPYLVYKNPDDDGPEIRGGIVDVLIVKATEVSKNDFLFQEAFLTTYRTFISPMELINKLIYRHNKFTNCTDSKQRAAKNAFALLVRVVDDLCVSDCSDVLMQTLLEFIYSLVIKGDLAFARVLRSKVIEKFNNRRNGIAGNQILLPSVNISSRSWTLHSFKSEIVAEQMTLVDAGLFQKVEVAEYLLWAREQKEELIPNLNKFTEHFNKMSYWTRSRIVEIEDPKDREKLVTKFIKIMKHLRKMNNFNSYLALLSALDSGPVRRLEWPKSITESLKDLCSLIDSSSSFRAYRQALAETQPPCIPYIGLILQDLTFVHIGNSDYLLDSDGNNINFAKRWQIFNILDQMRRFKNSHYPFKKNEQVLSFFNDFDNYLSEEAIWQISESIKPRLNNGNANVHSSPEKSSTSTNTKK